MWKFALLLHLFCITDINKLHGEEKGEIDCNYHGNDSIHLGNTKIVLFFFDYHTFRFIHFFNDSDVNQWHVFSLNFCSIWEKKECPIIQFSFRTTHHLQWLLLQNIFLFMPNKETFLSKLKQTQKNCKKPKNLRVISTPSGLWNVELLILC